MTTMIAPAALVQGAARVPFPYGLFSVVNLRPESADGGRWQAGGVQWETLPCGDLQGIGPLACDDPVDIDFDDEANAVDESQPFTVTGTFKCSPTGWTPAAAQQRATDKVLAREEVAVEKAVWTGYLGNTPSIKGEAVSVAGGTVGALEAWYAATYGGQGVIHMPLALAEHLLGALVLTIRNGRLMTNLGTPVVAGAGYDGTGPAAGTTWAAITPPLFGYRSDIFSEGALLDRAHNDLKAIASRNYLVAFDTCGVGMTLITE